MFLRARFAVTVLAAAPLMALIPAATTNAAAPATVAASTTASTTASATASEPPFCIGGMGIAVGDGWRVYVPAVRTRTGTYYESCSLRYGDRGGGVWVLQSALNDCYGFGLTHDGIYGPATRSAVRRVQQIHHITVDGAYGPQTMKAMKWRLSSVSTTSERCYRPLVNRRLVPPPASGSFSPFCGYAIGRYAGNGWWVTLPATVTRTGTVSFACYLRQGDQGNGVYELQHTLRYCYGSRLATDGVYGPQTKAVVQAVQRLHGVKADGVYGPVTMRAMYWQMVRHSAPYTSSQKCYSPF